MPSFHEGMSNSVLEAMACALPVVATAVSGNSDLVCHRQSGLLVPPRNPAALAAAIDELLDNPNNARDMGRLGRHTVETHYRAEEMINRCLALYARRHR
jgi:glycosyltransferase involved in cell wall biosynthesis